MAGIYVHFPFCKSRCNYCDFFSSSRDDDKMKSYVDAVCREAVARKNYLKGQPINTVYFGGGTPSRIPVRFLEAIVESLDLPKVQFTREITLEVNPDDISEDYMDSIYDKPFNRFSIGVQSFDDGELVLLGRRHNAQTAYEAVKRIKNRGYRNISIDLMYGLPSQTVDVWTETVKQALTLGVQHISAYHLTYERGTPLCNLVQQKILSKLDEDTSIQMFNILIDTLTEAGFEHYEISSFAKPGFYSKHNSGYWNGTHYIGLGAAAHSYNGHSRQWNVASITDYIASEHDKPYGFERIGEKEAYNDFIMTRLRTENGICLSELLSRFGKDKYDHCIFIARKYIENKRLQRVEDHLKLTRYGIFISDLIISDLMITANI
ncbi:MAG: radical SAM family heme chaperone HemW [Dysgonamonadaceae bacterium]|jgi:oxygen-independent coproporphyrinogen-3 oxidase|nr:radical SAM family heme chaperone HemW [Dysgonamonadaceae bacterium]